MQSKISEIVTSLQVNFETGITGFIMTIKTFNQGMVVNEDTPLIDSSTEVSDRNSGNVTPSDDSVAGMSATSDEQVTVKLEDPWPRTFEQSISLRKLTFNLFLVFKIKLIV